MTTKTIKPIKLLYKRLKDAGFDQPYVSKYGFPIWWEDSYADDPGTFYEAKLFLTRHLGLDLPSVLADDQPIRLRHAYTPCFKTAYSETSIPQKPAQILSITLAEIAATAIDTEYQVLPATSLDIRKAILNKGCPWIDFESLLIYLWEHGVPVLHLINSPKPVRMDGMVTMVNKRPVIVLARNEKHCAWQLFILAHEIGHIILDHIKENETIIDENIKQPKQKLYEQEANNCAIEILTGSANTKFTAPVWFSAEQLAHEAIKYSRLHQIDPGHIALNYGNTENKMPTARNAIKIIEQSPASAIHLVRRYLVENINPERISEDSYEFMMRLCVNDES